MIDFIIKLPPSKDTLTSIVYDSILVVVDRLAKYARFIPWREKELADKLAKAMLKEIVSNHEILQNIVSDRDKLFTSKFWNTWTRQLGTKVKLSTAYYLQTDRQTKRTNQTLEQYLQHYINFKQSDWTDLLLLAQFAYNNQQHSTIGLSPFYANLRPHLNWNPNNNTVNSSSEAVTATVDDITELHHKLSKKIRQQEESTAQQVNKKRLKGPIFRKGDKVYLLIKNLKSKQKCRKLDYVQIEPFKVEQQTNNVNYRLKLPEKAQIHQNFHVLLLEPAPADAQVKTRWNMEKENEYDVEKILDKRKVRGKTQYLIKWLGYENKENS